MERCQQLKYNFQSPLVAPVGADNHALCVGFAFAAETFVPVAEFLHQFLLSGLAVQWVGTSVVVWQTL
jgi:hypothetical protein